MPVHLPAAFSTCENESEPMTGEWFFLFPSSHSLAARLVGYGVVGVLAKIGGAPALEP